MSEKHYVTKKGLERLQNKHKKLRERIRHAEENEESLPLIREQAERLKKVLENTEVIHPEKGQKKRIGLGATVKLKQEDQTDEFQIVDSLEANPRKGKISKESTVGKALMGSKEGETVKMQSRVEIQYEIVEINY